MRDVVCIIPARIGSSRIPRKPLTDLCGRPLIASVYDNALSLRNAGSIIVATDSAEVAEAAASAGARTALTPEDLESGTDRVLYAVREAAPDAMVVVNLQGDEPFIDTAMVDTLIKEALGNGPGDVFTACSPVSPEEALCESAVKVVVNSEGFALYFSRSPVPHGADEYLKHTGVYVWRRRSLERYGALKPSSLERVERLEQLRALDNGMRIRVLKSSADSPGIDTEEDVERARSILREN